MFALWGSEEAGLVGARYFLKHPTFELKNMVANLEFEMIARPDPKVQPNQLWLTGWERTDLGPALAAHGAQLVGDPHPDQSFFMRSDNYALAKDRHHRADRLQLRACTRITTSRRTRWTKWTGSIWTVPWGR